MDMHAAKFGAAVQLREHLARIKQPLVIKRALDALLLGKIIFVEHFRHQVALFNADAVFAGQNPARPDAQPQNVGAKILSFFQLARLIGIIKDQRMQVAVLERPFSSRCGSGCSSFLTRPHRLVW